ncbi:hypothetical protein NON20_24220 (plasmid) [Synechocystis sp. B12]|nr:hypothetical protein NON20_24220 [Synechocystis sp. B12]
MKLLLALTLGFFYVLPILAQAPEMPEEPAPLEDATMEPMPDITLPPEPPPPVARAQTEDNPHDSLSLYDKYDDGAEVITFTGLEPHTYYEFSDLGGGYIAKATTNHCSMMTVKVPKKYPLASQPYGGHDSGIWNTGRLVNGTAFFWRNRPDWDNIVAAGTGADMTLPDHQINCAYIVGRFSWFAKLKDNVLIFYAADRDIPPTRPFLCA